MDKNCERSRASTGQQTSGEKEPTSSSNVEQRNSVNISKDAFQQLQNSEQHHSLALLSEFRERISEKHSSFWKAYKSMATGGTQGNKLTKLVFIQTAASMGFEQEDAEKVWCFIASIPGVGKEMVSVSREMSYQDFACGLRYALPVRTLTQLREKLVVKYGHVKAAYESWDTNNSGNLDFDEFCSLCMTVGCTAESAKIHFLEIVEHNAVDFEGVPKVTKEAFEMSLTHAEGLHVIEQIRQRICASGQSPHEAFA